MIFNDVRVVVRGAGELASAIAHRLRCCGARVYMLERASPSCVRRQVSFCSAFQNCGCFSVEGVKGVCCKDLHSCLSVVENGNIALLIDPDANICTILEPEVVVDATLSKTNIQKTHIGMAKLVIGIGPGFVAGQDCHFCVESARGQHLGRIIKSGGCEPNTHIPGSIAGLTSERLLRSPCGGQLKVFRDIGSFVKEGDVVGEVDGQPLLCQADGIVRGMLIDGFQVPKSGFKVGDVDPRADPTFTRMISDKGRTISGGVLELVVRMVNDTV